MAYRGPRAVFALLGLFALAIGGGCVRVEPRAAVAPTRSESRLDRSTVSEGIERVAYRFATSSEGFIEAFGFSDGGFSFNLYATSSRRSLREWAAVLPEAVAMINGSYFMENGAPSGSLKIDGKELGAARFDGDKSALIGFERGMLRIVDTSTTATGSTFRTAFQTYPFLIKNGASAVSTDSGRIARRSFVGTDRNGRVWIGVVANAQISLHELSRKLGDMGIPWQDVVNLDGGQSTGFVLTGRSSPIVYEAFGGVPNVIAVTRNSEPSAR